ncbi:MAG: T9SS type A sorting domain-containing protein, partial [Bacteroidales bacterium]|nr:T9SS type A sorting domain-containing protein [Bacteroidales bacterium]
GGNSWSMISSGVHVDQQAIAVHPMNPGFVVLGNDGGVYLSYNAGSSWTFLENLPVTQFYTCEVDEQYPHRLYGGTQDNGTNRTLTGNPDEWHNIYWGDGFYTLVDPLDNTYVYAEYQYGNFARSTNGGYSFMTAMSGISSSDRKNWNTPVVFDPNNPQVLYYGANRLYKSVNRAVSWQVISPDLTNGGGGMNVVWGTITSISVAASNSQYVYIGTDDGNVWRTSNGGANWTWLSESLPDRWVTRVAADPMNHNIVYVTFSGYRYDSYLPHIFRSTDAGGTWNDITGILPDMPVNDIIPDPSLDSTLYIATDFGVYVTRDLGVNWQMLGNNLPNVPVTDIRLHQPTRTLVAATYGRSMYAFNLDQLVNVKDQPLRNPGRLTIRHNPARDMLEFNFLPVDVIADYWVIDLQGRLLLHGKLNPGQDQYQVSLSGISKGSYLLIIGEKNSMVSEKFIKLY